MATADGEICLDRADGSLAELAVPGQPDRHVALHRRGTAELIAEELRRLDPDEAYAIAVQFGSKLRGKGSRGTRHERQPGPQRRRTKSERGRGAVRRSRRRSTAKQAAGRQEGRQGAASKRAPKK